MSFANFWIEVQHNHCQDVMHLQLYIFVFETLAIVCLFVLMHNNKLIGITDSLWVSLGGARPPNSGRRHLSRHMNINLGLCEHLQYLVFRRRLAKSHLSRANCGVRTVGPVGPSVLGRYYEWRRRVRTLNTTSRCCLLTVRVTCRTAHRVADDHCSSD